MTAGAAVRLQAGASAKKWPPPRHRFRMPVMEEKDDPMLLAFGEFVRAQRKLAQVSQRHLARLSGVSDSYLSQLERGNYRPSPQVVKALAQAFNLEPRQLFMMLGFMDDDDSSSLSVEHAIQLDDRLTSDQKESLIRVYRTFTGSDSDAD